MKLKNGTGEVLSVVLATKVEPDTERKLRKLAKANHRSRSAETRLAVLNHIEREAA